MNRKGFTLLELLATIIILGLITVVVIGTALPLLNRGSNEYYKNQENMLVLAARDYFADHRSKLPKEIGETATVTLGELIKGKYIDPIKDKDGNDCDKDKTTVTVQKITNKDYQYYVTLVCGTNKEKPIYETEKDNQKPTIAFSPNKESTKEEINIKMTIKDNKKVASYRYVIEKDGSKYFDSEYQNYTTDPTITLTEKGTYKITGYAIDENGNSTTKSSGVYEIYENLSCSEVKITSSTKANTWVNKDITVNISVPADTYKYEVYLKTNSGDFILQNTYLGSAGTSFKITKDGTYQVKVKLYDNYNNSCESTVVTYKLDKTKPKASAKASATSCVTTPTAITVTLTATETGSGIKAWYYGTSTSSMKPYSSSNKTKYSRKFSSIENTTYYFKACDNAGNCSNNVSAKVCIKKGNKTMWLCRRGSTYVHWKTSTSCNSAYNCSFAYRYPKSVVVKPNKVSGFYELVTPVKKYGKSFKYIKSECLSTNRNAADCKSCN